MLRARIIKGGALIIWDFHPVAACLNAEMVFAANYPLQSRTFLREYGVVGYASKACDYTMLARKREAAPHEYKNPHKVYYSEHSMSAIISGLSANGNYEIRRFEEFDFSWEERSLPWLIETTSRKFEAPRGTPVVPLTFGMHCVAK